MTPAVLPEEEGARMQWCCGNMRQRNQLSGKRTEGKKCGITMTLSTCSPLGSNRAQVDAMNIDSALRFKILFKELKQK